VRESLPLSAGHSSVALIVGFSAILLSDRRLHCGNAQPR